MRRTVMAMLAMAVAGGAAAQSTPAASGGGIPVAGLYQCHGGSAGNMKLRFTGGSGYANEQGSAGRFTLRPSVQMEFVSGPWKGFFAKVLGPNKVGLTSRADGTFYNMTCDRL